MDKAAKNLELLRASLARVEQRLSAACTRAGRERSEVTLVAVTKTVPTEVAALLPEVGVMNLGENRPQALWRKAAALPQATWHLIGHLQRNKIAATLPLVRMIHSVDSVRLLQALEEEAQKQGRSVEVLLEVNASGETSKQGFAGDDLASAASAIETLQNVKVCGLMTMAPLQAAAACRPVFAALRKLRDQLQAQGPPWQDLRQLSMGMSNDFEVAVEEGATLVRLGTVLLGELAS